MSHLLSFGGLGFLARFSWPRARPRNVATAIVVVAVLVEIVQIWVPGREAAVSHAVLEALGGLAGFGIAWVLTYAWGSGSLPEDYQASTHWHGENSDR
jgi:VanZ family protein